MATNDDIQLQIDALTAALPGASAPVRVALQAQIVALRAKLDAPAGNTLTANDINTGGDVVVGQKFVIHQTPEAEGGVAGLSALAQRLHALLTDRWFDLNDIQELAFQLDIDWDSLAGDAKPGKARALVRHCEKHDLLPKLQSLMRLARPNLREQLK